MACLCGVSLSPSPFHQIAGGPSTVAGRQRQIQAIAWKQQTPTAGIGPQAWRTWSVSSRHDVTSAMIAPPVVDHVTAKAQNSDGSAAPAEDLRGLQLSIPSSSSISSSLQAAIVTRTCCAENFTAGNSWRLSTPGGLSMRWRPGTTEARRLRGDRRTTAGFHFGARRRSITRDRRRTFTMAAVFDPHSLVLLSDLANLSEFPVRIELDPTREIITTHVASELSEQAIKTVYLVLSLLFTWGCCVFGSMNDKFYDSDFYRKAGGDGTGHWLYDKQAQEEQAAREEMWSEDLLKEIEEKAEEVRKAEEEEKRKKEKEVELV